MARRRPRLPTGEIFGTHGGVPLRTSALNRRRFIWSLWVVLTCVFFCSSILHAQTGAPASSHHVVIISLDGFRPEFYLPGNPLAVCETLTGLRDKGSYAKGALPPYSSMTYPGHTTIVTGMSVARHGVTANSVFEPLSTEDRGFWFATDVKAPALWELARNARLTVGAVSWPCTAGSKSINWNLPEFWTTSHGSEQALMRQYATTGLVEAAEQQATMSMSAARKGGAGQWDAFLTASAVAIIHEHKPNLLFVHLLDTDKEQHKGGRSSPELPAVLRRLDGDVNEIIQATKKAGIYESTTFIVLGDHGFSDVAQAIAPNVALAENGFIMLDKTRATNWTAMVQNTGGSAGVYLKNPRDAATTTRVRAWLEKRAVGPDGKRLYQIIDKEQLAKLGGPREAAFYLEAEPGHMFSGATTGEFVRKSPLKANHGFLPEKPEMRTGFIASGRGIKKGVVLDTIRLADVAPTVAQLLGIKMKNTDGRALKEILQ